MDLALVDGAIALLQKSNCCYSLYARRILCPFTEISDEAKEVVDATAFLFGMTPDVLEALRMTADALRTGNASSIDINIAGYTEIELASPCNCTGVTALGKGKFDDIGRLVGGEEPLKLLDGIFMRAGVRVTRDDVTYILRKKVDDRVFEAKATMTFDDLERALREADAMSKGDVAKAVKHAFFGDAASAKKMRANGLRP